MSLKADYTLCSDCFHDFGLRREAERLGESFEGECKYCGSCSGLGLNREQVLGISHDFFVIGTKSKGGFGSSPSVQFNDRRGTNVSIRGPLKRDVETISKATGIGFFDYAPRLWMIGEIEPLKAMQDPTSRGDIFERILCEYPTVRVDSEKSFFRIRKFPASCENHDEYDSPPQQFLGKGRFDTKELPIFYASPDIDVGVYPLDIR